MRKFLLFVLLMSTQVYASEYCFKYNPDSYGCDLHRYRVPHGWVVRVPGFEGITFVPDENHEWKTT